MNFSHVTEEVTLPTGIKAVVRELIGSDEDILSHQRYHKQNRTMEYLLKAIVQSVGDEEPTLESLRDMYTADRTALIIAARKLTDGTSVTGAHDCANDSCGEKFEVSLDIDDLEYKDAPDELESVVTLPSGMTVTYRPLKGKDEARFITARKEGDVLTTMILTRLVKVETKDGKELSSAQWRTWLREGSIRDRNFLREKFKDKEFGYITTVTAECPVCGEDNEVDVVGLMGFFFPSM